MALLLAVSGKEPSYGWAIADAVCCGYWVWMARRAIKRKADGLDSVVDELNIDLTDDQKARIKAATEALRVVLQEVDLELTVAKREKARVQSDERADQEDGKEGTDGRTDSKEDRTP
jgi:hypothetical protein